MSYNTPAEADAYFADLYGYDLWETLDEATKQQALNSAQQQLDQQCIWYGYPTEDDQDNAFPRNGDTEVPQDVKNAECEIAYGIVSTGSTSTTAGDPLAEINAGSVGLKFDTSNSVTTDPIVSELATSFLSQYGLCGGNGNTKIVPMMRQ